MKKKRKRIKRLYIYIYNVFNFLTPAWAVALHVYAGAWTPLCCFHILRVYPDFVKGADSVDRQLCGDEEKPNSPIR